MWKPRNRDEFPFDVDVFLKHLSNGPGVYRMFDANDRILYVGKARNLKRRVSSYFGKSVTEIKTLRLLSEVDHIEITRTLTEGESLILEANLIREHKPPFNILLKDDKSFPWLFVSTKQDYPRLRYHRGAQKEPGEYFGPYPNAYAVREAQNYLQRLFKLRPCEDSVFKNRSRPCLQFQIKRCSGPCVGEISVDDYREDVEHALLFLRGRDEEIINNLVSQMETAAEQLAFEKAGEYRDKIKALQSLQQKQHVNAGEGGNKDSDILGITVTNDHACVIVMFVRGGRNLGHRTYFPKTPQGSTVEEVQEAFLLQYYLQASTPHEIIVPFPIAEQTVLQELLTEQAGRNVDLKFSVRGERKRWQDMARMTADQALTTRLASDANQRQRLEDLQATLNLDELPSQLECFDISHTMGEATVASCVVFDANGPAKQLYRRFNIEGITGGDDYAAMRQAIQRRYTRVKKGEGRLPDILFIDGGKGQLAQAVEVMEELGITEVQLVGVAKGTERRPGLEQLFLPEKEFSIRLKDDSPALHLIQQIRDESHRFAISGHRAKREKARRTSPLEAISGLGPKRRQALLKHFGGLQEIKRAGVDDLSRVQGISKSLAQTVYDYFHS